MDAEKNRENREDLARLEQLVSPASRRIHKARARARVVSRRLAEQKRAPAPGKEDGWRRAA